MSRESKFSHELLKPVVEASSSMAEVLRKLGYKQSGGMHRLIRQRLKYLGIGTEHFTGKGWAKGKNHKTNSGLAASRFVNRIPDEEVFCKNSRYPSGKLRKRLIETGVKEECSECSLTVWRDKPIRLHVDHINGDSSDHRLSNLRFLCPNCHQQTPTWGNKRL